MELRMCSAEQTGPQDNDQQQSEAAREGVSSKGQKEARCVVPKERMTQQISLWDQTVRVQRVNRRESGD
jgi:hypothetical protein